MKLYALTTLLLSTTAAVATTLRGAIVPSPHLPNPSLLLADTTLTLTTSYSTHRTLLHADNTFVFRNLSSGSYLLETLSSTHHFAPYRVDVSSSNPAAISVTQTFRGNAWDNTGERLNALEVRAVGRKEHFITREGFSPLKMLGSPMILIAIVSLASIVVLPKVLDKMDPEFKAEFQAQSKRGPIGSGAENPLNFDVAGFLSGSSSGGGSGSAPAAAAAPSTPAAGGKGGKRR
ncbi:hypothetical protein BZA05DRAFT_397537 [Tricharina praecox]|uniref:uncharacterized protein n=1 Tax=Tricharina praecox TaxID=43433 RepID=UPI00221ECAF8|nr:uncharacterized protein BZA05DRAFT_397537 [Tricharina praecox]KAI5852318.1 hypothetical protein BZA05DRAFT_397537 [Tricharina praecox]